MHTLTLILDIALLRRGPQALPGAVGVTLVALGAYAVSGLLVQTQMAPETPPVAPVLLDLALTVALVAILLRFRGCPERFPQTMTAMAGTGTLLTLCGLPVVRLLQAGASGGSLAVTGAFLWLALVCWSLLVSAHILRHALDVTLSAGLVLAMVFFVTTAILYAVLFGGGR